MNLRERFPDYAGALAGLRDFQDRENDYLGQIKQLEGRLAWYKRQIFGQKSERVIDTPGDDPDLPGFDLPSPEKSEHEEIDVPGHKRRVKKSKREDALSIPDDLPREEIVHELSGAQLICPKTGKPMVPFGRDVVEKLACRPGEYYVQRHVHIKYKVPGEASSGVAQAPAPPCVVEGSKFDVSFMADLVMKKYGLHLPLNRIQEAMACCGIKVKRQTLSALSVNLGMAVMPLYELMIRRTLSQGVIFTDDTPVKMLQPGAGKTKKARMWIYLGGKPNAPPYHVYKFTEDWKHGHPIKFLKDFTGIFHADAYEAYEKLDADREDVTWAACWSHGRRKFVEALRAGKSEFLSKVVRKMRYLFRFERIAWTKSAEERLRIRTKHEAPIVEELFALMKEKLERGGYMLPKSQISQAIHYMLDRKENFKVYLKNPDIRMENNPAERGLRKVVLGKKNWLFVGSPKGGEAAAALLSLVQTCRAMKINPKEYLEDVFTRLHVHPHKRLAEFLPDQWLELRNEEKTRIPVAK